MSTLPLSQPNSTDLTWYCLECGHRMTMLQASRAWFNATGCPRCGASYSDALYPIGREEKPTGEAPPVCQSLAPLPVESADYDEWLPSEAEDSIPEGPDEEEEAYHRRKSRLESRP